MGKTTQRNGGIIGQSKIVKTPMEGSSTMGSGIWSIEEHSAISQIQGLPYAELNSSSQGTTREYTSGGNTYRSHEMTSSGNIIFYAGGSVDFLVHGGGGGGSTGSGGRGGGAGGAREVTNVTVGNDTITCSIGSGGWSNGNQTTVTSSGTFSDGDGNSRILSEGGGKAGNQGGHGYNGGAGGQKGQYNWSGPIDGKPNKQSTPATTGNNNGVDAEFSGDQGNAPYGYYGGGTSTEGAGNLGFPNTFATGSTQTRGGGGGQGRSYNELQNNSSPHYGSHGGGHGTGGVDNRSGAANMGGGGGGSDWASSTSGKGGSGVVVVRYKIG